MSLLSSLQLATNALQANQIGLQVVGQNIANANTPGFSREEVQFAPAATQRVGNLQLGLGVRVTGVVQKIDRFLEERLRGATSDRVSSETQEQTLRDLEAVIGALKGTDLGASLTKFFNGISGILNQPESAAARNLVVRQGETLAADFNRLASRVAESRADLNKRVAATTSDINRLLGEIRDLNVRISTSEGGDTSNSDAVGLRDQRSVALTNLAKIIDIRVEEQTSGATNVFANGDYLVFEGTSRHVETVYKTDRGISAAFVHIAETDTAIGLRSGELTGLLKSRDDVLGGFLDQLDKLAGTLAFEFNKVFSSGQGSRGYQNLVAEFPVSSAQASLDAASLPFSPVNGSFKILVRNRQTGITQTTEIPVNLLGIDGEDATLESLSAQLGAVGGVTSSIDSNNRLTLATTSPNLEIAFADDSSGVLAALGLNTFFSGSTSGNLGVNAAVSNDPNLFASSRSGVGQDTDNAVELANFAQTPLATADGATLTESYAKIVGDLTQNSAVAHSVAEGFRAFEDTLTGQQLATSGVSLDEEAIRMITFQRAYQATAKYIASLTDLLDVLVKL